MKWKIPESTAEPNDCHIAKGNLKMLRVHKRFHRSLFLLIIIPVQEGAFGAVVSNQALTTENNT